MIQLERRFVECQFQHIPRDKNARAHELARMIVGQEVGVHVINMPSYKGRESLEEEEFVLRTGRARKELPYHRRLEVTRRAQRYVIIHDDLYLKDVDGMLKHVLWHDEIQECLSMCHEEGCGGHFGIEYTKRKIMQTQVTWPSMYRDVVHWCRSCNKCQLYQQRRLMLEPPGRIVSYNIFSKWGLDIIGPLPSSSSGKVYIMSAVEYVS